MMAVLGKESPDPQQAEPLGVKEFRTTFDAIRTTGDYGAALIFWVIRAGDVTLNGGRLRVEWRMAKGKRNACGS
ncbi:hypothetical protein DIPPA_15249 [Diplonema papillatum]|nr:hypothetical protein DIPPA_15262 [Diplonema papillatum]KAJ9470483.1 hypothetical protein DIPPA_15249 [Diplonema papillatum]